MNDLRNFPHFRHLRFALAVQQQPSKGTRETAAAAVAVAIIMATQ